jgi:uncharacterized RDD family membrane protein YckC
MREYRAKETGRMQELDGLPLADFWQRAAGLCHGWPRRLRVAIVLFIWGAAKWAGETGADMHKPRSYHIDLKENEWAKIALELGVPVLYFGLSTFLWNGRTPGKRLFGVRVVSLVHERMTLWHSIERALGYGAAALEFGFGFLQFFIHPYRRTAQDRLAETIVVKEKAYRARFAAPD